jgi:hypothetical protein
MSELEGDVLATLRFAGEQELASLSYVVQGGPKDLRRSGDVDLSNSAEIRFRVGDLPLGDHYEMRLAATTQSGLICAGASPFSMASVATLDLKFNLACTETTTEQASGGDLQVFAEVAVNDGGLLCPIAAGLSADPLEVAARRPIDLQGFASSVARLQWEVDGAPHAQVETGDSSQARIDCPAMGLHTFTFAVLRPGCPTSRTSVEVHCAEPMSAE